MVRVIDHIDEIVARCFNNETRSILEFILNGRRVTVKDQFLFYYETACFLGTKESMITAILYQAHMAADIVLKIHDLILNGDRLYDLGEYSRVTLRYKEQLGTESSIGASANSSGSLSTQADQYSALDKNKNVSITDQRTGVSQTNRVDELKDVIPQAAIQETDDSTTVRRFSTIQAGLSSTNSTPTKPLLSAPQSEGDIGYQHFTKDLSTVDNADSTHTESSRGTESRSKNDSKHTNTSVKGNKSDEHEKTAVFVTNDARMRIWTKEIPRLKSKYWNSFFNLFVYEQT